jgi:twitching motility protein PilT
MQQLNQYLQSLVSANGAELHLEPNKAPYVVSANGTSNVTNTPLQGTQISLMIFPIIPNDIKQVLPNKAEVEFVHTHNLGDFSFLVKKSPTGFNVTIRPASTEFSDSQPSAQASTPFVNAAPPKENSVSDSFSKPVFPAARNNQLSFESSSLAQERNARNEIKTDLSPEIIIEEEPIQTSSFNYPKVEIVDANDPEFVTTFSDNSTYDEPGRRDDYAPLLNNHNLPMNNFQAAAPALAVSVKSPSQAKARMDSLFHKMAETGASDLHMSVSSPPMVRKDGKMKILDGETEVLTPEIMKQLLTSIMPEKNQEEFERRHDTDFAYEIKELARFRANIFMDRKGMGGVFRIIPSKILTAEQLGLSKAIMDLCSLSKGLVVVTGPTGSGKSTTLCAMIDSINKTREDHLITIEDPIEFTHENQKCLVNQREVHNHTDSFKDALRAALREDPDILLVGEMRDLETISIAIETAETGHLVFGTLHTTTAASTIDRIIDQFPADRQQQIRVMLSESLKGVIAQTLLPKKGGGRVAALEILIVTPAISNLIREGKTFQIPSAMQTGKAQGMVMLNDALFALVQKGIVEPRDAYIKAVDKTGFEALLNRSGLKMY